MTRLRLPPLPAAAWLVLRLGIVLAVILALNFWIGGWVERYLPGLGPVLTAAWENGTMLWVVAAYAALLALPFVPGVEIGLALLALFGAEAAPLVWSATLGGLTLSYLAGRLLPVRVLTGLLRGLGARGLAADVDAAGTLTGHARARALLRNAPGRVARLLLRHDQLALALLFNMPGNAVIGGGGGIALIAGLSRLYTVPRFVAVTAAAVAPVPLAVWLLGSLPMMAR